MGERADTSDPALAQEVKRVKDGEIQWVLFGYDKATPKIKVVSTGDGLDDLKEDLNDGKVLFAFLRWTVNNLPKFVYISWCGEGVTGMMKGRFNNHCKDLERFLHGFHLQINARTEADVEEKAITAKLTKAQGANYDAGQKVQGNKQGGVTTAAEGRDKAMNPKQKAVARTDEAKIDSGQKNQFWDQNKQQDPQYVPQRAAAEYNATGQRQQFWDKNTAQQANYVPQRAAAEYNTSNEQRQQFWDKNQQAQAPQQKTAATGSGAGARNLKGQFEQKAADTVAQPPPPQRAGAAPKFGGASKPAAPASKPAAPKFGAPPPRAPEPEPEPAWEPEPAPEPAYEEPPQEPAYEEPQQTYDQQEQSGWDEPQQEPQQEAYGEPAPAGDYQQAQALYDYEGAQDGDLTFAAGDVLNILDTSDESGWWTGEIGGRTGVFPSNFVQMM